MINLSYGSGLPDEILAAMMPSQERRDFPLNEEDFKLFRYRAKRNRANKVAKASRKRNR